MKQVIQSLKSGETELIDVPPPSPQKNKLLITTTKSLISVGTEKMLIDFGKASLINKARAQPDKVRAVISKINTDGLLATIDTVSAKLDHPIPLGYCNVGVVHNIGKNVRGFELGDRVVSNGPHAEIVCCSKNLVAKIPENVTDEQASFAVLGAIALQGIRLSKATLGEAFVVMGMGIIGLLTVQLLRATGCRVLAVDLDENRLHLAKKYGAETFNIAGNGDIIRTSEKFSRLKGVDAVIITASTRSNKPVHDAAKICRTRGRIILVGVSGTNISRDDFYEKELSFQVSSSYGPGRYDSSYEAGHDYPIGFVRWTAQRNFEAILDMTSQGLLTFDDLITHRFSFQNALDAYSMLEKPASSLGVLLEYDRCLSHRSKQIVTFERKLEGAPLQPTKKQIRLGFIGSGNYASNVLIPSFKRAGGSLHSTVSQSGLSSFISGRKHSFKFCSNNVDDVLHDDLIDAVVISTRHDSHAELVLKSLEAKKHVFLEKPLCLKYDELNAIKKALIDTDRYLMIGFNRRFSPLIQKAKSLLAELNQPKAINYVVNAGEIPLDHWIQDPNVGGGRIIGECCHYLDLLYYLIDSPIENFTKFTLGDLHADTHVISLTFKDGSIATINYFSNGSKSYPKEKLEIFSGGKILQLNNFKSMRGYGWVNFKKQALWRQDKGQRNCVKAFLQSIEKGSHVPIPINQIFEIAQLTLDISSND